MFGDEQVKNMKVVLFARPSLIIMGDNLDTSTIGGGKNKLDVLSIGNEHT